jgi:hypothetical protein
MSDQGTNMVCNNSQQVHVGILVGAAGAVRRGRSRQIELTAPRPRRRERGGEAGERGYEGTHTTNYSSARELMAGSRDASVRRGPASQMRLAKARIRRSRMGDGWYSGRATAGRTANGGDTMGDGCGTRRIGLNDAVEPVERKAPRSAVESRAVWTSGRLTLAGGGEESRCAASEQEGNGSEGWGEPALMAQAPASIPLFEFSRPTTTRMGRRLGLGGANQRARGPTHVGSEVHAVPILRCMRDGKRALVRAWALLTLPQGLAAPAPKSSSKLDAV